MGPVVSAAKKRFLLYGANGYTGRLILEAALEKGLLVTVAGRPRAGREAPAKGRGPPVLVFGPDWGPPRPAASPRNGGRSA